MTEVNLHSSWNTLTSEEAICVLEGRKSRIEAIPYPPTWVPPSLELGSASAPPRWIPTPRSASPTRTARPPRSPVAGASVLGLTRDDILRLLEPLSRDQLVDIATATALASGVALDDVAAAMAAHRQGEEQRQLQVGELQRRGYGAASRRLADQGRRDGSSWQASSSGAPVAWCTGAAARQAAGWALQQGRNGGVGRRGKAKAAQQEKTEDAQPFCEKGIRHLAVLFFLSFPASTRWLDM
ncbi:hypothetical protein ABZP36_014777 [Zizania latifolia]